MCPEEDGREQREELGLYAQRRTNFPCIHNKFHVHPTTIYGPNCIVLVGFGWLRRSRRMRDQLQQRRVHVTGLVVDNDAAKIMLSNYSLNPTTWETGTSRDGHFTRQGHFRATAVDRQHAGTSLACCTGETQHRECKEDGYSRAQLGYTRNSEDI